MLVARRSGRLGPDRRVTRAVLGACALGLATGWQIANTGAVAEPLAREYGVGLVTVGLFTTALFLMHLVMQIPGGRAADRFGPRRSGLVGLALIGVGNAVALAAPEPGLAFTMRALIGIGTGLSFVAGADYVRAAGASSTAQGVYGGIALAGGGLALAVVPLAEDSLSWRAPFVTGLLVAALALLLRSPPDPRRPAPRPPVRGRPRSSPSFATRASTGWARSSPPPSA